MRIQIAEHAGACYGVNRALALAKEALCYQAPVKTFGPLIHNPRVVSELERRGIGVADSLDEFSPGDVVVIRSHGVDPCVIEQAKGCGLVVVDATCPHVAHAQNKAQEFSAEGRFVVVVGEAGHPEVEAICAYAQGGVAVVQCARELPDSLPERVGMVVQTTQSKEVAEKVGQALRERVGDLKVANTICFATQHRQDAAAKLAGNSDVMLVVGGRNSGNTRRLYQICKKRCENSHHIESEDEIDPAWLSNCGLCGITAGASTPSGHIDSVLQRVKELAGGGI